MGNGKPRGLKGPRGNPNGGEAFGELKAQVAALQVSFDEFREEHRAQWKELKEDFLKPHENRIGKLEAWRTYIAGAVAALAVVWGLFRFFFSEGVLKVTGVK